MKNIKFTCITLMLVWFGFQAIPAVSQSGNQFLPGSKTEVVDLIKKVNNYWQENNPNHGNAFWHNAAYHTGNIEAYKITGVEAYKKFSEDWAVRNNWMGATQPDKSKWRYASYSEGNDWVMFGDWQIAFQVYIDLYNMDEVKNPQKIARAREVMEYQMSLPHSDYWWWVDGLYMVMPVMTKLYHVTGNELYLEKLNTYLNFTKSIMWDATEQLYYRDGKYVFPAHKTLSGKKDFWARGNGWAFAAFAKVLQDLPESDPHRNSYLATFQGMAQTLKASQQTEGYWTRSMLDPEQAPGYETSGTAFFTYGLLWGINNGLLNKEEYVPVAARAWNYLTTIALHANGRIGYVQPIGENAGPGQVVSYNSTERFGVGAFLLAAAEMYRYVEQAENVTGLKEIALAGQVTVYPNPAVSKITVTLPAGVICQSLKILNARGRTVAEVKDGFMGEITLALNHLTQGLYFVQLSTGKSNFTKKIIVE